MKAEHADVVFECFWCKRLVRISREQMHLTGCAICPDCARAERDDRLAEEADAQ